MMAAVLWDCFAWSFVLLSGFGLLAMAFLPVVLAWVRGSEADCNLSPGARITFWLAMRFLELRLLTRRRCLRLIFRVCTWGQIVIEKHAYGLRVLMYHMIYHVMPCSGFSGCVCPYAHDIYGTRSIS